MLLCRVTCLLYLHLTLDSPRKFNHQSKFKIKIKIHPSVVHDGRVGFDHYLGNSDTRFDNPSVAHVHHIAREILDLQYI